MEEFYLCQIKKYIEETEQDVINERGNIQRINRSIHRLYVYLDKAYERHDSLMLRVKALEAKI